VGRLYIDGAEQTARALFQIWVDLIKQRNGHIARCDIDFIANKIAQFGSAQKANLNHAFDQQGGGVVSLLISEAARRMQAVSAGLRRDLEIMVREYEAFPKKQEGERESMKQTPKNRYSVGRRVLVGIGNRPGTVESVADVPTVMGEFMHVVKLDGHLDLPRQVMGCDMRPLPELDADLRSSNRPTIHIQNSSVANLNLGSQLGTITANLQTISAGDESQRQFARALEELTQAVLSETALQQNEKQEVVDAISTLAEQGAKKPEQRSKVTLKAIATWIPTAISAANNLMTLWDKLGPSIKGHLGV
jgi:hypothetical protein